MKHERRGKENRRVQMYSSRTSRTSTPKKSPGKELFLGRILEEFDSDLSQSSPFDAPVKSTMKKTRSALATPTRLYIAADDRVEEQKCRAEPEADDSPGISNSSGMSSSTQGASSPPTTPEISASKIGSASPAIPRRLRTLSESEVDERLAAVGIKYEGKCSENTHNSKQVDMAHNTGRSSSATSPTAHSRSPTSRKPPTSPLRSPALKGHEKRSSQFASERSPAAAMVRLRRMKQEKRGIKPKTPQRKPISGARRPTGQFASSRQSGYSRGRRSSATRREETKLPGAAGAMRRESAENRSSGEGYDIIFSRARHGHFDEVQIALAGGMRVDSRDTHGNTLMHIACQNGHKKLVKMCLRMGASLNSQNSNGNTGLHFCFMYAYYGLGEYLLSKGADDSIRNADGQTCYEVDA